MMKIQYLCILVCFSVILKNVSGDEIISGRAVDTADTPLTEVHVALINQQIKDTTSSNGEFELSVPSTFIQTDPFNMAPIFSLQNNRIEVMVPGPQHVSIILYDVKGRKTATVVNRQVVRGKHSFSLHDKIRNVASGLYVLRFSFMSASVHLKITLNNGRISSVSGSGAEKGIDNKVVFAKTALAVDTLILLKWGYDSVKVPLESLQTQNLGNIILDYAYWEVNAMTFNIRGPADPYPNRWEDRKSRVFTVIDTYVPEILGFQELISDYWGDIADNCPQYSRYGRGRNANGGGESCMIYYLSDIWQVDSSDAGTFWYSETPDVPGSLGWGADLPRICTHARFINKITNEALYVFNSHFHHVYPQVWYNSALLLADSVAARKHPEDPFLVMGDFNANESSDAVLHLKQGTTNPVHMSDTYRILYPDDTHAGTIHNYTGDGGSDKIDYIMSQKSKYLVAVAEIIKYNVNGLYPSDHFPVYTQVKFPFIVSGVNVQ